MIDEVCNPQVTENFIKRVHNGRLVLLPKVRHGFSVSRNWLPQFREEFQRLATRSNRQPQSSKADLQDLPLVEVPAGTPTKDAMAVILSGDGGWAGIDREVAGVLAKRGIAVVGLNSLKYFWTKKTPEIAAGDLNRILRAYLTTWKKDNIVHLAPGYTPASKYIEYHQLTQRRSGVPAAASRNPFFRRRCHAPPQPSHGTDGRQRRPAAPWGSVLRGCPGRYGAGWLPCVGSLNGWLRLAAAGTPLRLASAEDVPVLLPEE